MNYFYDTMKKFFFLVMMVSEVAAQNRTNVWQMGSGTSGYNFGIDFNSGAADTFTQDDRWLRMIITNASICDTIGSLLFYTNGKYSANRNNDTLFNSEGFNPGSETDLAGYGMGLNQGVVIIPYPDNPNLYCLFHESSEPIQTDSGIWYQPTNLSYSVIDMTLDGGLGGFVDTLKNIHLIEDTLFYGRIAACKHANGRDWWIVVHEFPWGKYYKFLLSPTGIEGPFEQTIGINLPSIKNNQIGSSRFSPDGSKFCNIGIDDLLEVMDFNRCTGEFSNLKSTASYVDPNESTFCASFSPNNRFIYATNRFHVWQFDTWLSNLDSAKLIVADYDTSLYWSPYFYHTQLGADGYIYISSYGTSNYLHYIKYPDSSGVACDVVIAGLITPNTNGYGPPYFPNYDLGPLIGSDCDTLYNSTLNLKPQTPNFSLSPNPSSTYINIVYSIAQNATLTFTDAYGRVVKQLTLYPYFKNRIIYTDGLSEGVYLVTMREGNISVSKKVVVIPHP